MPKLTLNGRTFTVARGVTLKQALGEAGSGIIFPCGGKRACGRCRVTIKNGGVSPLTKEEEMLLSPAMREMGLRLACCVRIEGDAEVETPLSTEGLYVENGAPVSLPTDGGEGVGMVLDLGTTTLAAAFYDLKRGELLHSHSSQNPQREAGEDLISRIGYASTPQGRERLKRLITDEINGIVREFSEPRGVGIKRLCVCGNTVMELILGGYDVTPLGGYPFTPPSLLGYEVEGERLGLTGVERVYLMPCVGGFFGGDGVASILWGGLLGAKEPTLLADLGTNCELALTVDGRRFSALTAAAGPAFEGGGISCGCGSVPGAIHRVKSLVAVPECSTLGGKRPVGVCGSGLVDALGVGRAEGLISPDGALGEYCPVIGGERAIRIADEIYLTQTDVRNAQLAKAAVAAGARILIKEAKASPVAAVISGGFGRGVDPEKAARIGLLPNIPATGIGNGAIKGAAAVLLRDEARKKAEYIAKNTILISPAKREDFEDIFTQCMGLE